MKGFVFCNKYFGYYKLIWLFLFNSEDYLYALEYFIIFPTEHEPAEVCSWWDFWSPDQLAVNLELEIREEPRKLQGRI